MPHYLGLMTDSNREVSGAAYQRIPLPDFSGYNPETIQFPEAREDWGYVTHCGLYDRPSGGTLLASFPLTNSVGVSNNTIVRFPPHSLDLREDLDLEPPPPEPKSWYERLTEDLF